MKVISLNANGLRSAIRKGLLPWLEQQQADFICLQETKMQMAGMLADYQLPGYHLFHSDALKAGYSGVAIYSKFQPHAVESSLPWAVMNDEGRHIRIDFPNLSVISLYMPSGSSGPVRQQVKFECMAYYETYLQEIIHSGREVIVCADWNIVHQRIDIKNWTGNQKNSGCLPEERAWANKLLTEMGWIDAFRVVNQEADQYSWWSNRGQAWAKNVGWRIDYQLVTPGLKDKIKAVSIYKEQRFSDHAPVIIDYDWE